MTNFERIKAMTVEEMAKEIEFTVMDKVCKWKCRQTTGNKYTCPYFEEDGIDTANKLQCVKEWLNSEVLEE